MDQFLLGWNRYQRCGLRLDRTISSSLFCTDFTPGGWRLSCGILGGDVQKLLPLIQQSGEEEGIRIQLQRSQQRINRVGVPVLRGMALGKDQVRGRIIRIFEEPGVAKRSGVGNAASV